MDKDNDKILAQFYCISNDLNGKIAQAVAFNEP